MTNPPAPVVRQPFPKSPVSTDNSTLPSPTSTWTSFSATTSHGGTSPHEYHENPQPSPTAHESGGSAEDLPDTKAKWIQKDTFLGSFYPDTSATLRRARSPSVPVLPSQTHAQPMPHHAKDVDLLRSFNQLSIGKPTSPFPPYQARPFLGQESLGQTPVYPTALLREYDEKEDDATPLHSFDRARGSMNQRSIHQSFSLRAGNDSLLAHRDSVPTLSQDAEGHQQLPKNFRSVTTMSRDKGGKNVYFADLDPRRITEQDLERYGSEFGRVIMTRLQAVRDASADVLDNGLSEPKPQRHCGFVLFDNHESAARMIEYFRSRDYQCDFAKEDFQTEWKSLEDPESANLYIQGLPASFTSEQLIHLLAPFGKVVSHRFTTSGEGYRRGPVLARLECRPQAERAIRALNGKALGTTGHMLQVRISDSDAQKAFKRDANGDWTSGIFDPASQHRHSLPSQASAHLGQAAKLDYKRRYLLAELQAVEAQKADLFIPSQPYTQRGYDRDYRATPFAPVHEQSSNDVHSPRSQYDGQSSISSSSTHRTISMQSNDTSIWTPPASRTASGNLGSYHAMPGYNRFSTLNKIFGDSLHHIRSSPDLGDVTGRLWPGHADDL